MKVNQNLKINPKYKILAFLLLLGLAGCRKHKNVIVDIGTIDNEPVLVLRDVETDIERIYKAIDDDYKYSALGDIVTVRVGFGWSSERGYKNHRVFNSNEVWYVNDSIRPRKKFEEANKEDANFNSLRQRIQGR